MNGRHLEKRFPESLLQSIIIIPIQGPGNYQCHRTDGNEIQPELSILKQLSATPLHTHEIQREVDTRQNHKDSNHIFYKRRIPVSHTGLLGRIPSGSRRRKSMTCGIKQIHAANQQQYNCCHSQHEIYRPQTLCHDADFRMNLVVRHPRSLRREKHLIAHSKDRQYGNRKEHDSQSSNPLREASPEQHAVRKSFNIIQNGGSRSGKPRHGFKKRISHRRDTPTYIKRQHTETCEKQPRERHDAIPVASCHPVFSSSSQQNQSASHGHINQCRVNKINIVFLPIAQGNACTCQKHHCLHKEQDTQDAKNHLSVNQTVASVGSYIDRRR